MTKKYQNNKIDTPAVGEEFAVPERVSVAMAEIAGSMREGLLALAVGAGLQVMQVPMEADVTALAARRASTILTGLRSGTGPNAARRPWAAVGCR